MDALVRPIEQVVESTEWFVRTPSLRVLHIVTTGLLRMPVLEHVTATELLDANTCPFFVLEAPTEPSDDGWALRSEELRADWDGLRAAAPDSSALAPLWPEEHGPSSLARFALELGHALSAVRPPMTGLVIVLAPVWVRDRARWRDDLTILVGSPYLTKARFIVVEVDEAVATPVVEKLGPAGSSVDARIDDGTLRDEMSARLDAMKAAPPGATALQLLGAAGPAVAPPPRKGSLPPLSPAARAEVARAAGIAPALLDQDVMQALRVLVLSAAGAMRDGQPLDAVRWQREARDLCVKHGLVREAVVNELVLAGFVLQAGSTDQALPIFQAARQRAEAGNLITMAVQAQMGAAACLLVAKRVDDAAAAYAEAGQLGAGVNGEAASSVKILAIEAYRMCGQLRIAKGRFEDGAAAFRRALEIAEAGGDTVKAGSTAAAAARQLAAVCRKHGLVEQAVSLDAQADAIENAAAGVKG